MISRANGNSRRGHSISTIAFRLSCGTFWMRNTPANSSSKRNISLPPFSALPSSLSVTSMSVSRQRLGVDVDLNADLRRRRATGVSDCGAFGFSNEKSLMYCATTLSCGCWLSGRRRAAIGRGHETLLEPPSPNFAIGVCGGWLTQGLGRTRMRKSYMLAASRRRAGRSNAASGT